MPAPSKPAKQKSGQTLVARVSESLRQSILSGQFPPGSKLPSEAQLTTTFGVSRTVVREAVAALRSDALVEPRQGAGVFVLAPRKEEQQPFQDIDPARISSVIAVLELRAAVEVEAAGLAAIRRSPEQEERLWTLLEQLSRDGAAGKATAEDDLQLHLAIADATNNPRFAEFLILLGRAVIPRAALPGAQDKLSLNYHDRLAEEHLRIVEAISNRDEDGARAAMRAHLQGSQARYRAMIRSEVTQLV